MAGRLACAKTPMLRSLLSNQIRSDWRMSVAATTKPGQKRSVEEAVSYAVGHRIRIEILGPAQRRDPQPERAGQADRASRSPRSATTSRNWSTPAASNWPGSRRSATPTSTSTARSSCRSSATKKPSHCRSRSRQQYAAVILQALMAEGLAALWAGKMSLGPGLDELALVQPRRAGPAGKRRRSSASSGSGSRRSRPLDREPRRRIGRGDDLDHRCRPRLRAVQPVGATVPATHRLTPGKN